MYVRYGNYISANNECGFTATAEAKRSQGGTYFSNYWHYSVRGDLLNYSTQAAITTAIQNITTAFSQDGQDFTFLLDDGVTPTAHQLLSARCIGGTRVIKAPSFPDTYGSGEYQPGYGRSYNYEIAGELPLTGNNVYLNFTESLRFHGNGGPIIVYQPVAEGPWIPQTTSTNSLCKATQSGSAVGLYGYPPIPGPIWPGSLINQEIDNGSDSPRHFNKYEWPVSWHYSYQSNGPLIGLPTIANS
jgi:hypothetical protein